MASWRDSVNRLAQSAVTKGREMAEITRLNVEISGLEQRIRELYANLGEYLVQHEELLPASDETVGELLGSLRELREKLERTHRQLLEVKQCGICPGCGAEVSLGARFCDRCGTPAGGSSTEEDTAQEARQILCASCGAAMEPGVLFCENCGARLEAAAQTETGDPPPSTEGA